MLSLVASDPLSFVLEAFPHQLRRRDAEYVAGLSPYNKVADLDLVIAIDGMIAHLARALGVPVWVLVDLNPHYTWGLEGRETPWYSSARIFRQKNFKNWASVFDEVGEALAAERRKEGIRNA